MTDLERAYAEDPMVRALVTLAGYVPGVAVADAAMIAWLQRRRAQRLAALFDELQKGGMLTPELIASDEFLHRFTVVAEAAVRTRREEKVRMFACLLMNSTHAGSDADDDVFDELLVTLEGLSLRELRILAVLDEYEESVRDVPPSEGTPAQWARWGQFVKAAGRETGLTQDELRPFMNRLIRTGLYESLVGHYDWNGEGRLTPLYFTLKRLVTVPTLATDP